ncbi:MULTISPECIES: hypothetical protein [unclassified Luteococcus]|uniref:hypothetical protein n=1 Tax=unclassified Luteococcus TaxID=2639923 RepID=UPI00313E43F0
MSEVMVRPEGHDDGPPAGSHFQRLEHARVRRSTAELQARIRSRFPNRTLWEVCGELVALVDEVAGQDGQSQRRVRLARVLSRLAVLLVVVFLAGTIGLAALDVLRGGTFQAIDFLPLLETMINNLVFGGLAVLFLLAVPERMERARILRILHRLRSLAHVIDMHQLTKIPERHELGAADLKIYLEQCSEMLSLVGKTGALFAEDTTDGDVLDAVEGIEALTSDMARKVWQKIAIIQPG